MLRQADEKFALDSESMVLWRHVHVASVQRIVDYAIRESLIGRMLAMNLAGVASACATQVAVPLLPVT